MSYFLTAPESQFVAVDIDIQNASRLAGEDLHFAQSKWESYNALWFDVLHSICKNHLSPVLLCHRVLWPYGRRRDAFGAKVEYWHGHD